MAIHGAGNVRQQYLLHISKLSRRRGAKTKDMHLERGPVPDSSIVGCVGTCTLYFRRSSRSPPGVWDTSIYPRASRAHE